MYKQKPVFPQKSDVDDKTYFRRLVGRINKLKGMIEFRTSTKISEVQSQIDELDEQIVKLQKKKEKLLYEKKMRFDEISNIRSEITEYTKVVNKLMSDDVKPLFQVYQRTKKSKIGGRDYQYYEGRVRSRMRKGFLMKDKYYHIGDFNESRRKVKKVFGTNLPRNTDEDVLKKHLKKLVEKWWLEDLDTSSL